MSHFEVWHRLNMPAKLLCPRPSVDPVFEACCAVIHLPHLSRPHFTTPSTALDLWYFCDQPNQCGRKVVTKGSPWDWLKFLYIPRYIQYVVYNSIFYCTYMISSFCRLPEVSNILPCPKSLMPGLNVSGHLNGLVVDHLKRHASRKAGQ